MPESEVRQPKKLEGRFVDPTKWVMAEEKKVAKGPHSEHEKWLWIPHFVVSERCPDITNLY